MLKSFSQVVFVILTTVALWPLPISPIHHVNIRFSNTYLSEK
jgi:hypothetical protein